MNEQRSETCRRCGSAALVVTPANDGTQQVVCSTCGRRFRRVAPSAHREPRRWPYGEQAQ